MRNLFNQAQLTLDIENFLKCLKRRSREWDGFYSQLTNLLLDFNDIYDPDDEYPGYLQFFIILIYDLQSIDSDEVDLKNELESIGYRELRSDFLKLSKSFERDYEIIEKQKDENKIEVQKYCESIIGKYSRILVARVDLGYLQEYSNRIRVEDIYKDLDVLLNRIQNKDGIFKHVVGYIWGVEQGGKSKGFHCHLAIIYDNAYRDGSAAYWGDEIIELWRDITRGYGQGYNCWNRERVAKLRRENKLGIGVIYRRDSTQVTNFIEAMEYLTDHHKRTLQYLRVKPRGRRVFGKGQLITQYDRR
ncbi:MULTISPECIES: inovirus-type Gp2 protein [unclassified Acinetobacter]|uniref:YagK/YfjJ domain-containing protein n=1 Tax=unclassified Acinetobacter TaxID=196816 RepID=UPI0015D35390|nr:MULTISPECIES: inovirus-type Gp2 protein [unclassified Acinetobacter]UUS57840.1 inovirus Gp2 family protein [Acinetobacter sp. YH16040_T]